MRTELILTKACTKCGDYKPLAEFTKDSRAKSGVSSACRHCTRANCRQWASNNKARNKVRNAEYRAANIEKCKAREKEYRKANLKKRVETVSAWRKANPERHKEHTRRYSLKHQDKVRARGIAWNRKNPERVRARSSAWYEANKERSAERQKRWVAANRAKVLANARRHQAMRRNASCDCCQSKDARVNFELVYGLARVLKKHVDHVRPLAKGGRHCLHNLQLLDPIENLRKGAKWQEAA